MAIEWLIETGAGVEVLEIDQTTYDGGLGTWVQYTVTNKSLTQTATDVGVYITDATVNAVEDTIIYPSTLGMVVDWDNILQWWEDDAAINGGLGREGLFISFAASMPGEFPSVTWTGFSGVFPFNRSQGNIGVGGGGALSITSAVGLASAPNVAPGETFNMWIGVNPPTVTVARRLYFNIQLTYGETGP